MGIKRREFLQLSALTFAAGVSAACGVKKLPSVEEVDFCAKPSSEAVTNGLIPAEAEAANPQYLVDMAEKVFAGESPNRVNDVMELNNPGEVGGEASVVWGGSFLNVRSYEQFATGIPGKVFMPNYPGHDLGARPENFNNLGLSDFAHSMWDFMSQLKNDGINRLTWYGHSFGTEMEKNELALLWMAKQCGISARIPDVAGIGVCGGGPPKIELVDYAATLVLRAGTLQTAKQMTDNPDKFITPEGDMRKTMDPEIYKLLWGQGFIRPESKQAVDDAFWGDGNKFNPRPKVLKMGVPVVVAWTKSDYFVPQFCSERAVEGWGAKSLEIEGSHSAIAIGEGSENTARMITELIEIRRCELNG